MVDQKYSFKSNLNEDFPFQSGNASVPVIHSQHQRGKIESKSSSLSLLSSVPPPQSVVSLTPVNSEGKTLLDAVINAAHLPPEDKQHLRQILESTPHVCTLCPGRTEVLEHRIYTTHQVPIKQRPYRITPAKQAVIKEQLEEMLAAGIVEPSHSEWASPVVLVPNKDGSLHTQIPGASMQVFIRPTSVSMMLHSGLACGLTSNNILKGVVNARH